MPRMRMASTPKGEADPKAIFTEYEIMRAAAMVTFDATHQIWADNCQSLKPIVEGDFVRLYPPAGSTPERIDALKRHLLDNCGASAVKVMAPPVAAVADTPELLVDSTQPERPVRRVVMERAARTNGVRDLSALEALLTQCMDKAGI